MKNNLTHKLKKLKEILKSMGQVLVAYSGGVDSSFLLKVSKDTLGDKVLAVTATSETYSKDELTQAKRMTKRLGVRHIIIKTDEFSNPSFKQNPIERCYYCKKELFCKLRDLAQKNRIKYVLDGTNNDDTKDYRPGSLAKEELGVRSPLKEIGLSKEDIRILSRRFTLSSWDKPALACLASRIPYGVTITKRALQRIDQAERFIRSLGFKQVRVRDYNSLARIEVEKKEIPKLVRSYKLEVISYLKKIGYTYVTIDLEGYRTGSMNPALSTTKRRHTKKGRGE